MLGEGGADPAERETPGFDRQPLTRTLRAYLDTWQPRQRRTAGLQAALFNRLDDLARAHPEWESYDLLTHLLAALHLVIESDRLTGGHTRGQVVEELIRLVAFEQPGDPSNQHRAIAEALVDVLLNTKGRHTRLRDRYLLIDSGGAVTHPEQSFHFVRTVGDEAATEPTLRATPEAINIFQNLFEFDPSDRAAAERYRSERMLHRRDYDEVLSSVDRRATGIHGLRSNLERLLRRISYNVRDVEYADEVVPQLDEALAVVREQVEAEERFADAVSEHAHRDAPDLERLQRITGHLHDLIRSLTALHRTAITVKQQFEEEQDRQLFTYRRVTINPQSGLLEPLLEATPEQVVVFLETQLATWMGVRPPQVINLQAVVERTSPTVRQVDTGLPIDPFDLGAVRGRSDEFDPAVLATVDEILSGITNPVALSELLVGVDQRAGIDGLTVSQRLLLPWALAMTVASAYGVTDIAETSPVQGGFDHLRLAVLRTGRGLGTTAVSGDDLVVVPRHAQG